MPASLVSPAPAERGPPPEQALARACGALWVATLSLMTAYMHQQAPAHRYLLARRISRNLLTLRDQDCFDAECRARFAKLSSRWEARASEHHPDTAVAPTGLLAFLFGAR